MIPAERQKIILEKLRQQEVVSINELMEELNVSHMTIRRDIAKLEKQNQVITVAGGVQLLDNEHAGLLPNHLYSELSHISKITKHPEIKSKLGEYAARLIMPNATVYLDAGTTILALARQLIGRDDLTIITNDFTIAQLLMDNGHPDIYFTGGKIDVRNKSCVGSKVAAVLGELNIDIAFISTSSWDLRGISSPSEDKVIVKKAIVESSKSNILLTDASKFNSVAIFQALPLSVFDQIITDKRLAESVQTSFKIQKYPLIIVD